MGQKGENQLVFINLIQHCDYVFFSPIKVDEHKNNLLNYIIFLRITPFLPNWFINITSPVIGVPLSPFFIGTFLGNIYI